MKKFIVLYRSEKALTGISVSEMFANSTPEQMAAWEAWHEKCGSAIVDLGAPLDHSTIVTSGGATAGKTSITGYNFLQAASVEAAARLIKNHPHLRMPGSSVEVLESVPMPGM